MDPNVLVLLETRPKGPLSRWSLEKVKHFSCWRLVVRTKRVFTFSKHAWRCLEPPSGQRLHPLPTPRKLATPQISRMGFFILIAPGICSWLCMEQTTLQSSRISVGGNIPCPPPNFVNEQSSGFRNFKKCNPC